MKFKEIVSSLKNRKYVAKETWNGKMALVMGMDNVGQLLTKDGSKPWTPCLADLTASDWVVLPFLRFPSDKQEVMNSLK